MLFSSATFLFLFLPVVLGVYFLLPDRYRNLCLFAFSLLFYAWGEGKMVLLMLASVMADYCFGLMIEKGFRKTGVVLSIFVNVSLLLYYKYATFLFENYHSLLRFVGVDTSFAFDAPHIILPLGISFYTFQKLSYTLDVYFGNTKANRSFIEFGTYVTMFPQLIAGPIVRYVEVREQLSNKQISVDNFARGIERFVIGLAKKMILANYFALIADTLFEANAVDRSTLWSWIGAISYAFQIFYDFSGYSDMAIGLGKMFGFDFPENFNYPYISKSIQEFWRRWHMTLSFWFRDYVYIPLGGNRKGNFRTYSNLFVVFFITGFWHGASWNFVVWGLFHGFFIIIERLGFSRLLNSIPSFLRHGYVLLVVLVGWIFFRAENLTLALQYLQNMFWYSPGDPGFSSYFSFEFFNRELIFISLLAVLSAIPWMKNLYGILTADQSLTARVLKGIRPVGTVVLFIICIAFVSSDSYNPFIYFRF